MIKNPPLFRAKSLDPRTKKQVDVWIETDVLEAYNHVRKEYFDAFLSGGYLRDRALDLKPKDVDIFTFQAIKPGNAYSEDPNHVASELGGVSRVLGVEKNPDLCSYPVDIIHLNPAWTMENEMSGKIMAAAQTKDETDLVIPTARAVVEMFSLGIQQILYDAERNMVDWTLAFHEDVRNRTMTVFRVDGEGAALSLFNKWKALTKDKFQGWKLVVPRRWEETFSHFTEFGEAEGVLVIEDEED